MRRLIFAATTLACFAFAAGVIAASADRDAPGAAVYVSPDGSDERSCRSRSEACATLNRAYRAARPGDIVEVASGDYPEQRIVADESKTSRRHVVIRPAKDARVTLAGLTLGSGSDGDGPRHLTIERMRMAYATPSQQLPAAALPGTVDVVWRDIDAGSFALWGVKNLRIRGGDWGPCAVGPDAPCSNSRIDSGPPGFETDRVTIDRARFHDYRFSDTCYQAGQDCHYECMYLNGSSNVTVSRSTFQDCALFDIFVTLSGPDAARVGHRNLKLIGNVFDTPWDENPQGPRQARSSAVTLAWCQNSQHGYRNVDIAYNSFQSNTGIRLDEPTGCRMENVRVVGNLLAWDGCDPRWSYAHNVWSTALRRGRCARGERIAGARLPYASAKDKRSFALPLRSGRTAASDAVPRSARPACPRADIDGDERSRPCDAGADEAD